MDSLPSSESLPPEILQQIHAQCDRYEAAWQAGQLPMLDNYLGDITGESRAYLLRKLEAIELQYQPATLGAAATDAEVTIDIGPNSVTEINVSPDSPTELDVAWQAPRDGTADNANQTKQAYRTASSFPSHEVLESEETIAETHHGGSQGGLQIRCPHCCNGVELLADTPFEEILCDDCGSTFNLVDREKLTTAAIERKSIGRFELEERVGSGGFGTVWKARDADLDRVVAIKIPRKGQLRPEDIEQFYREARAVAQLHHPNIVPVHEVGSDGDTVFIVSDLIVGVSLSEWLVKQRVNNRDVAQLCVKIADALDHAHQQGIIHRDLKPSNVMIDQAGEPHLMDFGLAKREVGEVTMTVDGQILGTPTYMSPEQAGGQSHWVDRRTDIYSLGVMIFKLLTDELPYRGNIQLQIQQRLTIDPPDPRKLNRFIPRDLSTICLKCLERDPNRRYSTAQALADEFRRFLRGEPILARPISRPARLARWAKRKPALAAAAALTIFLAIAGPLTAWHIRSQRDRLAELVVEKNNLIDQLGDDNQQNTAEINRLTTDLSVLTGGANPWEIWPPAPGKNQRLQVLRQVYRPQYESLELKLQAGEYDDYQLVCGHLGLAIMADELKLQSDAIKHYLAARDLLEQLSSQQRQRTEFSLALADCNYHLARLYVDNKKEGGRAFIDRANEIYQHLANQDTSDARVRVGHIETETVLGGILADGDGTVPQRFARSMQLVEDLKKSVPNDPISLYETASYLASREPILESRREVSDTPSRGQ